MKKRSAIAKRDIKSRPVILSSNFGALSKKGGSGGKQSEISFRGVSVM